MFRKTLVFILAFLFLFMNLASDAYGFYDDNQKQETVTISVGDFEFKVSLKDLDAELIDAFIDYYATVSTLEELYGLQDFLDILEAVTTTASPNLRLDDYLIGPVQFSGRSWSSQGRYIRYTGQGGAATTMGFLQLTDRSLDGSGSTVHPIIPPASPAPEDNVFITYDIRNALTDNLYSIRLMNGVELTTSDPVQNLESISFYALRGLLRESGEPLDVRNITVAISATGNEGDWVEIASYLIEAPPAAIEVFDPANPVSHDFPFYTFSLTQTQMDNEPASGYYISIDFDGDAFEGSRSRVVIDELRINTTD